MFQKLSKECEAEIRNELLKNVICKNCQAANTIIYRPWRDDYFCGYCFKDYKLHIHIDLH